MTQQTIAPAWPEPYLQPDPTRDCEWYSAAYVARALGRPNTTVDDVRAWRERTNRYQTGYAADLPGIEGECLRWNFEDEDERRRWWLGPGTREWVERHLADGWIADVRVHRVSHMTHAVVLLDAFEEGVLLMDPVYGHVIEPWDWFLGIGPGTYGCHRVEYWLRAHPTP